MAVSLPSDIIRLIVQQFDKATDILSCSLVCRRHHQILLSRIKHANDKATQALLDRFLTQVIRITFIQVYVARFYSYLPNGVEHGTVRVWKLANKLQSRLMQVVAEDAQIRDKEYINPKQPQHHTDYINTPVMIEEALTIIAQDGKLDTECYKHLGKYEGKMKDYQEAQHRGEQFLWKESTYSYDKLDGDDIEYLENGNRARWFHYTQGRRNG